MGRKEITSLRRRFRHQLHLFKRVDRTPISIDCLIQEKFFSLLKVTEFLKKVIWLGLIENRALTWRNYPYLLKQK